MAALTTTSTTGSARSGIVRPSLSHFEITRLLATRANALANGAATALPQQHTTEELPSSAIEIAKLELARGLLPLQIRRRFPSGRVEMVNPNEFAPKKIQART